MTASSRPAASPRCSTRCGSGARTAPRRSTARPRCWPTRSRRRARRRPAARRSFPASALRSADADRGRRRGRELIGRADVRLLSLMDHTPGPAPVPRRGEAARLLPRQEGRPDRRRARRAVRRAARRTRRRYAVANYRASWSTLAQRARRRRWRAMTTPRSSMSRRRSRDGVAIAEFPTTLEAAEALHAAGVARADGRAQPGARRLACRQRRDRRARARPACSTSCRPTMCRRAC